MAKVETTKRSVMEQYNTCIQVGYCDLQYLLGMEYPQAYTHGVYGWNADVYDMSSIYGGGIAIVTGYRPFGKCDPPYDLVREYEEKAMKVTRDKPYGERKEALRMLIAEFVDRALAGRKKA